MIKYEIQNIIPFNDIYYVNCVEISILTALRHFNGSVFDYIVNDNFVYKISQTSKGLTLNLNKLGVKTSNEIFINNDINIEDEYDYGNEIVDIIINTLNNGGIAIIPIDGFFYNHPYHDLFYLKEHHNQVILVYGYDCEKKVFNIIDVNGFAWDQNNFCYTHSIGFSNLIECHKGAANFKTNTAAIWKLSKTNPGKIKTDDPCFYKNMLIRNMQLNKTEILEGLKNISTILENIDQFDIDETTAFNNKVASASNLYKIKNILGNEYNNSYLLDEILNVWIVIQNLAIKNTIKKINKKKKFGPMLRELHKLESTLYEDLFSFFDRNILSSEL